MSGNHNVLEVHNLTGGYERDTAILHNIQLSISRGEIVGLIGLNGAGKSTTIKMLLGLLQIEQGEIRIGGYSLHEEPVRAKEKLGYIPEIPLLYDEFTLEDHLRFTAMAYRMTERDMHERRGPLLSAFRMEEYMHAFPSTFSKGMRQKVMIMCALLHQPDLLLVDEPFIGLDPRAFRALTNELLQSKQRGAGVLVTTHVLDSAEKLCDRFIILHNGKVIATGTLEELRYQASGISGKAAFHWSLQELFEALVEESDGG